MLGIERTRSALNHLDPSCSREDWIRIGMSAKVAGLSFADFHQWSRSGDNYSSENDCNAAWKSFKASGGITERTLFSMAIANGWQESVKRSFSKEINQSGENTRRNRKDIRKLDNESAKLLAYKVWERCLPALATHDYIMRKQGKPDGLRYYPNTEELLTINQVNVANHLVVPCWSDDEIETLQFIPPDKGGKKLNLNGASFNDGYFTVGIITDRIYICEGLGQAWALNKSTGHAAVVCFGAGRMMTVAKVLHAKYLGAHLVVVPDRGKEKQAAVVAAAINGHWIEMPNDKQDNYDVNDFLQEFGVSALISLLGCLNGPEMRFKLLSGMDLGNAPPMRWLVHGVIPAEGLAAIYGASGSGKSFLILDMGCAIAAGDDSWFRLCVTQAPVIYICLEGEAGMGKRLKAWSKHHDRPLPDSLRFITQAFNLLSNDVFELAEAVIAAKSDGGLLIIDTLNRSAPGADENSPVDMGNIITAAKKLQSIIGGLVLLVHHTGKDATKGLRGHSSLYAALDGAIEITARTDSTREWTVAKSKDEITGDTYPFKLDIVPVGVDESGDGITSCVVLPDEGVGNVMRRLIPPKSGNQKIIWEGLGPLFRASCHNGQAGAPMGKPCIRLEEAIEKTRGLLLCEPKRQSERASTAITGLVTKGLLLHRDGWIWGA